MKKVSDCEESSEPGNVTDEKEPLGNPCMKSDSSAMEATGRLSKLSNESLKHSKAGATTQMIASINTLYEQLIASSQEENDRGPFAEEEKTPLCIIILKTIIITTVVLILIQWLYHRSIKQNKKRRCKKKAQSISLDYCTSK